MNSLAGREFMEAGLQSFAFSYPIFVLKIGQSAKASYKNESSQNTTKWGHFLGVYLF